MKRHPTFGTSNFFNFQKINPFQRPSKTGLFVPEFLTLFRADGSFLLKRLLDNATAEYSIVAIKNNGLAWGDRRLRLFE